MKFQSLTTVFVSLALVAGCTAGSSDGGQPGDQGDEQDITTASVKAVADATPLKNDNLEALRALYTKTTYANSDITNTTAFSFGASASMSDAEGLVLAKAIAKKALFNEVTQHKLSSTGTAKQLARLAHTLESSIRADYDDTNTPPLTTAMVKAFSLPEAGKLPGQSIKIFSAIGQGDDHDGDNVDREAIFVDTATGEALVLQGQSIDM